MRAPGGWTMKFDVALLEAVEERAKIRRGGRGVRREQWEVLPPTGLLQEGVGGLLAVR